jgi:hypothetical protein
VTAIDLLSATEVDGDASLHHGPIAGHVTPAHRRFQAPAASNVATSNILFLAWIVRRIDIGDRKRPFAVNLNDGLLPDRRRRRPRLPDGRAAHWYAEGAEPQQAAAYLATPRTRENPQDREMISQPA